MSVVRQPHLLSLANRISVSTNRAVGEGARVAARHVTVNHTDSTAQGNRDLSTSASEQTEVFSASPTPRVGAGVTTRARSRAVAKPKTHSYRVSKQSKNPIDRLVTNTKLRALLSGRKTRAPKRNDQMVLRVGKKAENLNGYELTSTSPEHD